MPKYIEEQQAEERERLQQARQVVQGMIDRINPVEARADIIGALGLDTRLTLMGRAIDSTTRDIPRVR